MSGDPQDISQDKGLIDEIRSSVLVGANVSNTKGSGDPTLADFKMIVVLGKGTFGKVFLAEFSRDKQLYAIKVIRKDILIEYN
jgi:serine/threonine protein kinase